jgi:hypothetical protein
MRFSARALPGPRVGERLQLRHHSVVELVNRAQKQELVEQGPDPTDARAVRVQLTADGQRALMRLSALHRDELQRMDAALTLPIWDSTSDNGAIADHPQVRDNPPEAVARGCPPNRCPCCAMQPHFGAGC